MQKNYTINNYKCQESGKSIGHIVYELTADDGKKRLVSTKAKLGFSGKLKAIQAFHHRESPLVEVLSKSSPNDSISVDFTEFNNKHKRDGSLREKKLGCRWNKVNSTVNFSV